MNAESPLSIFDSVNVISLRPGDVLLFRCPGYLTNDQRARATAVLNEVFPAHETMILDGGQDIAVLRPEPGLVARIMQRLFGKAQGAT